MEGDLNFFKNGRQRKEQKTFVLDFSKIYGHAFPGVGSAL
jgi:hypothetical protein